VLPLSLRSATCEVPRMQLGVYRQLREKMEMNVRIITRDNGLGKQIRDIVAF